MAFEFVIKGVKAFNFTTAESEPASQARPTMTVERINQFGLVTLAFNSTLLIPQNWSSINETDLDIWLETDSQQVELMPLKGFSWRVKSFGTTKVQIQIFFEHPDQISKDVLGIKDKLAIQVKTPAKFFSFETRSSVQENREVRVEIPIQFDFRYEDEMNQLKSQAE